MIQAIFFDCFGVLTADTWHEFRRSIPFDAQPEASKLNQQYCQRLISKQYFLDAVAKLSGQSPDYVEQVIDQEKDKNYPLLEYIKELKEYYKIGLLSNVASSWIQDKFLTLEEQSLFDDMVFSYEVGMIKPDPRLFKLAADRLEVQKEECLLVDDIEHYVLAAKNEGWQAVQYQNLKNLKHDLTKILAE